MMPPMIFQASLARAADVHSADAALQYQSSARTCHATHHCVMIYHAKGHHVGPSVSLPIYIVYNISARHSLLTRDER